MKPLPVEKWSADALTLSIEWDNRAVALRVAGRVGPAILAESIAALARGFYHAS